MDSMFWLFKQLVGVVIALGAILFILGLGGAILETVSNFFAGLPRAFTIDVPDDASAREAAEETGLDAAAGRPVTGRRLSD